MVPPAPPYPGYGMCLRVGLQALKGVVIGGSLGMRNLILGNLLGPGVLCLLTQRYCPLLRLIEGVDAPEAAWSCIPWSPPPG